MKKGLDIIGKVRKTELPVYLFFLVITFCKGIDLPGNSVVYLILYIFGVILLGVNIFRQRFTLKELAIIGALISLGVAILFYSHNSTPLFMIIAVLSMKDIKAKKILRMVFIVHLICFCSMVLLSSTGIIDGGVTYHYRRAIGMTVRHNFGYISANLAQLHLLSLIILYYYAFEVKNKRMSGLFWGIISVIIYYFTRSRTSFYISLLFLMYQSFFSEMTKIKIIVAKIGKYSFILLSILTLFLAANYGNSLFVEKIDLILTGRLYYLNQVYDGYSIKLLGQNISDGIFVDNSYFGLLYKDGLLMYAAACFSNMYFGSRWIKKKEYDKLVACLFLNIMLFAENYYLVPIANFVPLLYAEEAYSSRDKKESKT